MMRKSLLPIMLAACALFIDGNLTRDIFDYRPDSFSKWATVILISGILVSILWPKNSKDKNNL
jgi:hypothetical protein